MSRHSLLGAGNKCIVADTLRYKYKENVFTLELLSPPGSKKAYTFRFMLVGLDKEWKYLSGRERFITYKDLSCGEYTLIYKVYDGHALISSKNIKVLIEPAYWQTSAFRLWVALVTFVTLVSFLSFFLWYRRKNKRELDTKVKDRTRRIEKQRAELLRENEELSDCNLNTAIINEVLKTESDYLKEMNQKIMSQKEEIEVQSLNLYKKNAQLTQSLNYARRIQSSLLPSIDEIRSILPKSALFFQPRELVSGDFYWFRSVGTKIILAEIDCTGHGVPGAFMSMIGNTLLNEIVVNREVTEPADIFLSLNEELTSIFTRNEFEVEDQDEGMDLTLVVYDTREMTLKIASAMQNFFVVKNGEVEVYKGDIFSIGGLISRLKKPVYNTHVFNVEEGLRVIICSDGFIDQFGSEAKDKYGVDRFVSLIGSTLKLPVDQQIDSIKSGFFSWKGTQEQLDDVLIVGVEF